MARKILQGRNGRLRLLSGDTPPYYIEIPFVEMNLSAPISRRRPIDPVIPTVGGYFHAPTDANYDGAYFEPITLSFSFWMNESDTSPATLDALCNPYLKNPWVVGNSTWSTSKGKGSIVMPDLSFRPTVQFFDQAKKAINIEAKWTSPQSGSIIGFRWEEIWAGADQITLKESADFVSLEIQALCYGNILKILDFTAGNASA